MPAGGAAEAAEHLRVNDAEPGAGQHGDGQLGHHRHVQGHPVAGLQADGVTQHRRELVHLSLQFRIADRNVVVGLQFRYEDDRGLVRAGLCVPVHAVVRGVQLAADEPLPERRVTGVEGRVPGLVPGEQVRVLPEAVGEVLFGEPVEDGRVLRISLLNERGGWRVVRFLAPVRRDLRLRGLWPGIPRLFAFCHGFVLSPEGAFRRQRGGPAGPSASRPARTPNSCRLLYTAA